MFHYDFRTTNSSISCLNWIFSWSFYNLYVSVREQMILNEAAYFFEQII